MRDYQPIDKDMEWDEKTLEVQLYLKEGYRLANLEIRANAVYFELLSGRKEEADISSSFLLPVPVKAERNRISQGSRHGCRMVSLRLARDHATPPGYHPGIASCGRVPHQLVS